MEDGKTIIEVNGVKLEIDLRTAKRVDTFRVGDRVKILTKKYESYRSEPGVIVGFDAFVARPTIIVAYLSGNFGETAVLFAYINADSKDIELCAANPNDLDLEQDRTLEILDRDIATAEKNLQDRKDKRAFFIKHFGSLVKAQ